ncbi:MAG: sulfatase-like hydrolase/transferase [Bacteroidota bacterium]
MKYLSLLVSTLIFCSCKLSEREQKIRQPNFVILLADDLGYADVGFHGSDIQTPHLDKFAREGVRLESFYSCPMCTPTRAGLMTGLYPIRYGLMRSVIPPYRNFGLNPELELLPEMLNQSGYAYRACVGKWHLGHLQKKWHPIEQGFTHFVGCYNGAIDYFTKEREGEIDWHRNSETIQVTGYVTDLIADEAVRFIHSVPKEAPYFLYVPFTAPHSPFQAKKKDFDKYPHRSGKQRIYAAMVDCLDQGVGRILDAIDRRGDRDNTFILFFSDNGGVKNIANNSPMRGNKLTVYEGGIRVVAAAHWPTGGIEGGKIIKDHMGYIDIFPTLKSISQGNSAETKLDGINVLDILKGKSYGKKRKWFTYLDQSPSKREKLAVHFQDLKLIVERDAPDTASNRKESTALFQLDSLHTGDKDVAEKYEEVFKELFKNMEEFLQGKPIFQNPRYREGKFGFKAPKDWIIE